MAWLSGYAYRQQIPINHTDDGAQTNYQKWLTVNKTTGTSVAGVIYLQNHALSWTGTVPNDVRFTKSDGSTELDYWIESSDANTAQFALEHDAIPAHPDNGLPYIYYGKLNDTTTSNGPNTFPLFDHFTFPDSTVIFNESGSWQCVAARGIELPNGDLLVAWEYNDETNAGYIKASRYSGGSWGTSYTLVDTADLCDVEPQFLVIGSTVYFFYSTEDLTSPYPSTIYYKTSTDNGNTWSSATTIGSSSRQLVAINPPIICDSGRIVLPIQYLGTTYFSSSCYYSDSPYTTWTRGGNITESSSQYINASVVEKSNGDLLMYMRRYSGGLFIYQAVSTDEAATWGSVSSTGIKSPALYPTLRKLANGHICLVWNNVSSATTTPGSPLTVAISTDDCATFPNKLNIRGYLPGESTGGERQCIFQKSDGTICVVFNDSAGDNIYICQLAESSIQNTWEWEIVGNPASSVASGVATITSNSIDDYFRSNGYTVNQNVALRFREKDKTAQVYPGITGFGHYNYPTTGQYCVLKVPYTDGQYCIAAENSSGRSYSSGVADDDDYHVWEVTWLSASCKLYNDAVLKGEVTTYIPNTALMVSIGWARADIWYSNEFDIDWILVRKYTATEPTWGTPGSEETEVTPKTSSDTGNGVDAKQSYPTASHLRAETGSGADAKITGNPYVYISKSETGSGAESLPARNFLLSQSGAGVESLISRFINALEIASGLDVAKGFFEKFVFETGSGLDIARGFFDKFASEVGICSLENSYLHILENWKESHETGTGVDASTLAILHQRVETGSGIEAVIARALYAQEYPAGAVDLAKLITATLAGQETGSGAETSLMSYYQKLNETGSGADSSILKAMFTRAESGAGIEAITLLAVMLAHDSGVGVETVLSYLRKLVDSGAGSEVAQLIGGVGRTMKARMYTHSYFKTRLYTRPYYKTRLYTEEVRQ